ncbi:hypothetical protein CBR_g8352 [Chara braunii]|uniref:Uncharacterized protein n=1 Tax=Chara braunii TaxID=69332 RepID=A0A388KM81_CHABU|nr:hypothetical protein CBR_g8352 [Chara braunii]|eukprot:GBG71053.1 hypothetical protein CBR_g8352 [Chara braunii]
MDEHQVEERTRENRQVEGRRGEGKEGRGAKEAPTGAGTKADGAEDAEQGDGAEDHFHGSKGNASFPSGSTYRRYRRNDIQTALAARTTTLKEKGKGRAKTLDDHGIAADKLLKYLQGDNAESSRDREERGRWLFTPKNRGQRVSRKLGTPEESEDGGEATPRSEKQGLNTKPQGMEKKVPASCSREGVTEYFLNIRKKYSELTTQEIKKLCIREGTDYT